GLQDECANGGNNDPAMLLPHRWLTKLHDAVRRQPRFANVPSLQLAPVKHRTIRAYWRRVQRRRHLATKDMNRDVGRMFAEHPRGNNASADGPAADVLLPCAKYRSIGRSPHAGQSSTIILRNPTRIYVHDSEKDRRRGRK